MKEIMFNTYKINTMETFKEKPKVRYKTVANMRMEKFLISFNSLIITLLIIFDMVSSNSSNKPPRFLTDGQSEIVIHLKETPETPIGSLIYTLRGYDPENDTLIFGKRMSIDSDVIQIVNQNSTEAFIYLAKELDREIQEEYLIILTLTDNRFNNFNYVTQSLLILIEDINDNAPIFLPYPTTMEIAENSKTNIVLNTLEAVDADAGAYGQVVYYLQELDGNNDLFAISTHQGKGVLRLIGNLDYERKNFYHLRILAVDRANQQPINTGTATVLIKVQDVEDQPPEFVKIQPLTKIVENAEIGTKLLRIECIDGDRGINNPIHYELEANDLFAIEADSGWIYTINKLDREDSKQFLNGATFTLKITASEISKKNGNPLIKQQQQQSSLYLLERNQIKTEVTVIIMDVNDEIPEFNQTEYSCEINENALINTPLNFIQTDVKNSVFDYDIGSNGTFELYLEPASDLFEILPSIVVNEANFILRVKNSKFLDFENFQQINFTLYARELVETRHFGSAQMQVFIRDQNDNFPIFKQNIYNITIPENSEIGTFITKIEAVDADSGDFGSAGIRYRNLRGGIADLLNLNPTTGVIRIQQTKVGVFDREMVSHHYLTLEAIDNMGDGNRNTVQLIINLKDVNDNAPVFLQRQYETILQENKLEFEQVLQLEARDIDYDGSENSQITYEIVDGMYRKKFAIDAGNGTLRPIDYFDYEELISHQNIYRQKIERGIYQISLLVRARDSGIPMLSTVVPVIIYIQDVNDNSPIFQRSFYAKEINEDLPAGASVIQVLAEDRDGSTLNSEIIYRLENSSGSDKFVIDSTTGIISVAKGANLDPQFSNNNITNYTLRVMAFDRGIGNTQLMNFALVNITIKDINNKVPILPKWPILEIKENTAIGTHIYKLTAIDLDENPILRYSIDESKCEARNEDGVLLKLDDYNYLTVLQLNPIDGSLTIAKVLDREIVEELRLSIMVEDLAADTGQQVVSGLLIIHILDENDNPPKFKMPFYKRYLSENSLKGVLIGNVMASDPDKNRSITYSLVGDSSIPAHQLIRLDSESGEFFVADRIDHEEMSWLNFSILARDSGIPPLSSVVNVYIVILDENDNNPYFLGVSKNYTISELTAIGTKITTIQADDADSGDFGKVNFLLDRISSEGKFSIDSNTGVLSVIDRLDREQKEVYMLIVEVWDNYKFGFFNGESRGAFKQLFITLLDENDNPPELLLPRECILINEYHDLSEKIINIKASDKDDNRTPNGRLEFNITNGNKEDFFILKQIDAWTATIYARESLRQHYGNYTVVINLRDLGEPSNTISRMLNICVTDVNDHAPEFIQPLPNTTIRLAENATIGTLVTELKAIDMDFAENALVKYRLKTDSYGFYETFDLQMDSGKLFLRKSLNRTQRTLYELRVEAYDQGVPTSLSSSMILNIYIYSIRAHKLDFIVNEIFVSFTEQKPPGLETIQLPKAIDKADEVQDDYYELYQEIYYSIQCGNQDRNFALDIKNNILSTLKELDREFISNYTLFIKATTNYRSSTGYSTTSNAFPFSANTSKVFSKQIKTELVTFINDSDDYCTQIIGEYKKQQEEDINMLKLNEALLQVHINILDINDNPPQFRSKIFTGGITTNTDYGINFMRIEAFDLDVGENAHINYYQVGDIRQTLSEGLEHIHKSPFLLNDSTGEVQLNFDPQQGMKGYFDFKVMANDSMGQEDFAHVFIYLLREDQKARFVFRLQPKELRDHLSIFREILSNVTDAIVNVDEIKVYQNQDGTVDKTKTDLYLHLVSKTDNTIYEVDEILDLIDLHIEDLNDLFKELNVVDTQPAEPQLLNTKPRSNTVLIYLIFINILLAILLTITLIVYYNQRKDLRRQLKAARVNILQNSTLVLQNPLGPLATQVPNTNKHCLEGSNPVWLPGYNIDWCKNKSDFNINRLPSLESNYLGDIVHDLEHRLPSKPTDHICNKSATDNFNRSCNILNKIDKITNNAYSLSKRLETTEL